MGHRWEDDELLAPKVTPPPRRSLRGAGAALAAVAIGVAGCGDGSDPGSDAGRSDDAGIDGSIAPMPPPMPGPDAAPMPVRDADVLVDAGREEDATIAPMPPPLDSGAEADAGSATDAGVIPPMPPPMPPPPMPPPPPPMPAP